MSKVIKVLSYPIKLLCMFFVNIYRWCISPLLPHTCRYVPSCSKYSYLAIKEFGVFKGIYISFKRIIRCGPKHDGGYDFLPQNIKGDSKWLI